MVPVHPVRPAEPVAGTPAGVPRPARVALPCDTAHTTRARNDPKCQYMGGPFHVAAPPTPSPRRRAPIGTIHWPLLQRGCAPGRRGALQPRRALMTPSRPPARACASTSAGGAPGARRPRRRGEATGDGPCLLVGGVDRGARRPRAMAWRHMVAHPLSRPCAGWARGGAAPLLSWTAAGMEVQLQPVFLDVTDPCAVGCRTVNLLTPVSGKFLTKFFDRESL